MRQFLVLIRSPVLPCEGVGDVATASGAVIAMGVALREVVDGAATTGAMDVAGAAAVAMPMASEDDILAGSWIVRWAVAPVAAALPVANPADVFLCRFAVMHT